MNLRKNTYVTISAKVKQWDKEGMWPPRVWFIFYLYLPSMWSTRSAEHHDEDLRQQAEQNEQDDDQPGRHGAQHVGKNKVQTLLPQERPASQETHH